MATEVWAIGMVRDEADVIGHTLSHLADEGVDGILIADNLSTDGTRDLLADARRCLDCRVEVLDDPEPGYYQSAKMTRLAARAADLGATWIVPFDADEVWFAHSERLAVALRSLSSDVRVVEARLFNHFATALDLAGTNPFETMIYRQRRTGALPKVAFRWSPDVVVAQGNHAAAFTEATEGRAGSVLRNDLEVRHFPYRSFEQFKRKAANGAAAYAATDLPDTMGAHWRQYGELLARYGDDALREVWDRWYWFLSPTDADLARDPAPFMRWT